MLKKQLQVIDTVEVRLVWLVVHEDAYPLLFLLASLSFPFGILGKRFTPFKTGNTLWTAKVDPFICGMSAYFTATAVMGCKMSEYLPQRMLRANGS